MVQRKRASLERRDRRIGIWFLVPTFVVRLVIVAYPPFYPMLMSLFRWRPTELATPFVGLKNFRNVVSDPAFLASIGRGLTFAAIVVPAQLVIAFVFASLAKSVTQRVATLLKISIYIPAVISGAIASIVFTIIYAYRGGLANWLWLRRWPVTHHNYMIIGS